MRASPDTGAVRTASALEVATLSTIAASTIAAGLPRSGALTDALLAVASTPETLAGAVTRARRLLEQGLAEAVGEAGANASAGAAEHGGASTAPAPAPPLLRIGHYQVAQVMEGLLSSDGSGAGARAGSPFRWTSRAARRSIGLAALRVGLDSRAASPAEAVAVVMTDPIGPAGVGRSGPGSCADWIASLAAPARALVAAEAAAWATRLWTALDWGRLPPHHLAVGAPDRWWRWSSPSASCRIAVRGRADVRVGAGTERDGPGLDGVGLGGAHLLVLDGLPGVATRHALLLGALVDALSSRRDQEPVRVPARVVGWWPDCGKSWVVPVDAATLLATASAVVATARALLSRPVTSYSELQ